MMLGQALALTPGACDIVFKPDTETLSNPDRLRHWRKRKADAMYHQTMQEIQA